MKIAMLCDYPLGEFMPLQASESVAARQATPVCNLVRALEGHHRLDLHVVTLSKAVNTPKRVQRANTTFHFLPCPPLSGVASAYIWRVAVIQKLLNQIRPDLVHGQGTERENGLAAVSGRYPHVVTIHGILSAVHKVTRPRLFSPQTTQRILETYVLKKAHNLIAIAPYVKRELEGRTAARFHSIENAVHPKFFEAQRRLEGQKFLFVGSLYPLKGLLDATKALYLIHRDTGYRPSLCVVGTPLGSNPGYQEEIVSYLRQHGLHAYVEFCGWKDQDFIAEAMTCATALLVPSAQETAPMVIAEALAAKLPVVAYAVGGIPEMIRNGVDGYVVPRGDIPALADGMLKVLDPVRNESMGSEARLGAHRFQPHTVAVRTLAAYESILGGFS